MYDVKKLATWLSSQNIGLLGTNIFIGKMDSRKEKSIVLSNEAGAISISTINGRSSVENDTITIKVSGTKKYSASITYINKMYELFRNNKQIKDIGIINLVVNQPVLIDRVVGEIYLFAMTIEIMYNK